MTRRYSVMAGYYIFYYAAVGIYLPFLPLFLAHSNLDSLQIGFLMSVGPLTSIFAQAAWGTLADRYHRRKEFLLAALALTALVSFSLSFGQGVPIFAFLLFLYALMNSAITPLSDAIVLNTLDDRKNYGKIRRWGSFGFALTAAFGGWIFSHLDIAWFGTVEGVILIASLFWAKSLPNPRSTMQNVSLAHSPLSSIMNTPGLPIFLMVTFLLMVPYNAYTAFFGWHMQTLGASRWWIGLGWMISALSEMLVFSVGSLWLKRFRPQQLIILAGFIFALRWATYSFLENYQLIIFLQITQSLSFALFYLAGVEYLNVLLPSYLQGSAQAAFNAVSFGMSAMVGTLGAGWIIRVSDVHVMYGISALLSFSGMLLAAMVLKKGEAFLEKNSTETILAKRD